ncbi:radical SAM protein, partial [Modestobacter sp. SSW1-42]
AETGGAWTVSGGASNATVSGGAGHLSTPVKGSSVAAYLNKVSSVDTAVQFSVGLDAPTTGGGLYVYSAARHVGSSDYRLGVRFPATGAVTLQLSRMVDGVETTLKSVTLSGVTYSPGQVLVVRFDVAGNGTTTLSGKAWVKGSTEPAAWQLTATDTTAALQSAGGVGLSTYLSGSATVAPVVLHLDDFWAGAAGTAPQATPMG